MLRRGAAGCPPPNSPPRKPPAAGRSVAVRFELLHPVLQVRQRLLLHQDRLRHVVGGGRHRRHLLADVRLGLGVALRRLLVELAQLAEQLVDDLPLVAVHGRRSPRFGDLSY